MLTVPMATSTAARAAADTAAKAAICCDRSHCPLCSSVDRIASQAAVTAGMSKRSAALRRPASSRSASEASVPPDCCKSAIAVVASRAPRRKPLSTVWTRRCLASTASSTRAAMSACGMLFGKAMSTPGSVRTSASASGLSAVMTQKTPRNPRASSCSARSLPTRPWSHPPSWGPGLRMY
eukprot:1665794-Prymnesium_polylepis.2